jgi:hypothetical protein
MSSFRPCLDQTCGAYMHGGTAWDVTARVCMPACMSGRSCDSGDSTLNY